MPIAWTVRLLPIRNVLVLSALAISLWASTTHAQITTVGDDTSAPIPGAGHDYIHMLSETVNPANGSVSLRIEAPVPKGRGINLPFSFAYDSNGTIHLGGLVPGGASWQTNSSYLANGGWSYSVPEINVFSWSTSVEAEPQGNPNSCSFTSDYMFQDPAGGRHSLYLGAAGYESNTTSLCASPVINGGDQQVTATLITTQTAGDSSPPVAVSDADGTTYYFSQPLFEAVGSGQSSLPNSIEDRNGNIVTSHDSGKGVFTFTDSVGRQVISSTGFGPLGATQSVTVGGLAYEVT
jgi:hypothetical protein